jgi:glycosyltransferase A (GT-A) superfamily protein (DUF2064 family)
MSAAGRPAVLVMGGGDDELDGALGPARASQLRAALGAGAQAWARELAGEAVYRADPGTTLGAALDGLSADRGWPLVVVWPWLAQLRSEHAAGLQGDLGAGSDVVLGPVIDGGLYLLALARPVPALHELPEERWQDPDVMTIAFAAAAEAGLEVGILRAERGLRTAADVRAALADPLLPGEIRAVLQGG